jgi:hypothetical protein
MKTPTFEGTESEMLLSSRNIKRAGAGAIYKKYPSLLKEKNVIGIRSVPQKLPDYVEPFVGGYEGSKVSFYAPEINPIGMRGSGLKNRLLKQVPDLSQEYSLQVGEPALEVTLFGSGKAIKLKKSSAFSEKAYKEFQDIYGLSGREKKFSVDVSLGGIKVPKGKTFGQAEYEKIIGGKATYRADKGARLSRPIKNRETINITSQEAFEKNFINMDKSLVAKEEGLFSTEARSVGATSESEFATARPRMRVPADTKAKKIFRKLGFADAYVKFDFEAVPINYEKAVTSNLPVPFVDKSTKNVLLSEGKPLLLNNRKTFLLSGKSANIVKSKNSLVKVSQREGDYSNYLKKAFNKKFVGELSSRNISSKKVSFGRSSSKSNTYSSKYVPLYNPKYAPKYVSSYKPTYTPKYTPAYTQKYTPTYNPTYKPAYPPKYTPPYTPKYTPKYTPPYTPKYTPPYRPKYTPPYTPPVRPKMYPVSGRKTGSGKQTSYDVYVRGTIKGTKTVSPQLVARDLPINRAINEGTKVASEFTQRTVQLKRSGFTGVRDEELNRGRFQQYRGLKPTSKIQRKELNYVENSKFAIDSRNEKLGIPFKGQQAQRKKAQERRLRLI